MPAKRASTTDRQPTSSTARLSAILDRLTVANTAAPVADTLASVFEIKDGDPNRMFLLAYTAITRMLESSQKEVETHLGDELDVYGASFPRLRQCFNPKNSGQPWNSFKANLTPTDVTAIKFTAQHLKTFVSEYEAKDTDLADIQTAIEEMSRALDDEALSAHSQEKLRGCLDEIKRAVDEYKIWGTAGLNQAYIVFTGTLVTDQILQDDLRRDSAKGGTLWDKVKTIGGGLMLLLGILHGVHDFKQEYLPTLERLILPSSTSTGPTIEAKPVPGAPSRGAAQQAGQARI